MAVQVETQGQLQEFLHVLKTRRWQVLLPAIFVLALGCVAAVIVPKKYKVHTRIELRETRVEGDARVKGGDESPTAREIVNADAQIKHRIRIEKVILDELKWDDYARLDRPARELFLDRVMRNIDVAVLQKAHNEGSTFVDVWYSDVDPKRAEQFLDRISRLWVTEVIDRDRNVLRAELDLVQDRLAIAERKKEEASQALATLLQQNDLELVEPTGFGSSQSQDKVDKRLAEAQAERVKVQTDLSAVQAQIVDLERQWDASALTVPISEVKKGVDAAEQVTALEGSIKALKKEQSKFKPAHSSYRALEEKIHDAEEKLAEIQKQTQSEKTYTTYAPNPERPIIRSKIDDLGTQAKGLEARREELDHQIDLTRAERQERVDLLRKRAALKTDKQLKDEEYAFQQKEFDRKKDALATAVQAIGNPFEFAEQPVAPSKPNLPNPWVIIAFSGVAGLALGLAWALLAEYTKSCYRGVQDLARVMDIPVLGAISSIITRAELMAARRRRVATAVSTVVILGGLTWFTWAWAQRPGLLPTALRQAIEDIRLQLK